MENQIFIAKFVWLDFRGYNGAPRGRSKQATFIPKHPEGWWDIFVYFNHVVQQFDIFIAPIAPIRNDLDLFSVGDLFIIYSLEKDHRINAIGLIERVENHSEEEFFEILHLKDKYSTL